jgi:hypothetical protein
MTTERRYRDEEVREIFGLASRQEAAPPPGEEGLSLAALQEIGREVGLSPAVIARAAATLDARAATGLSRGPLGIPTRVGRVVPLPRQLTDPEWERLVVELRTTFGAQGRVSSQGGLREWVNGNLHACVEPSADGYRLRLGTKKGDAAAVSALGATGLLTGMVAFAAVVVSGAPLEAALAPWAIAAAGAGTLLANLVRLPRWARLREAQMAAVAASVESIVPESPAAAAGRA